MGRPSLLRAAARRAGDGIRARVGGRCVPVLSGEALL
jgi:trans-2,3-dihydro-3-hydroxyanthranilate isomerase